ncbi:MAG: LamG domain-containing protein [Thaumarchaeota archaeon]|nr:LamG domain-containing protein [Nitrososphaerota archaeon]
MIYPQSQLGRYFLYGLGISMVLLTTSQLDANAMGNSTNSTMSTNQTMTHYVNSTQSISLNNTISTNYAVTKQIVNATGNATSILKNITIADDLPISDSINLVNDSTQLVLKPIIQNVTSVVSSTNQTISPIKTVSVVIQLPNATTSITSTSKHGTIGDAKIENETFHLGGQGYISQSVQQVNSIKALTVSAWVLPDYTQGSAIFTVISKEGQFALTINNLILPKMTAQFSIFDGISWTTVTSTIIIPSDSWTHLSATYNRTNIAIFVNGTLQSSMIVHGVLTIEDNGHLAPVTPDHISSNSDVVIGASIDSIRDYSKDKFSGQIDKVHLYDKLLNSSSIYQIYKNELDSGSLSNLNMLPS